MSPSWLPPLVCLQDHGRQWSLYVRALYDIFTTDFITGRPDFRGEPVALISRPLESGRHVTFWHITSDGKTEEEREPDIRRCERIRWPKAIIEHCEDHSIRVWSEPRNKQIRVHLWLEQEDYVVVLGERKGYAVLVTTFLATEANYKRKLRSRYEKFGPA